MEKKELGIKLRELREEKGYSQHILAEKAHIGNIYLGEIERGLKMPSTTSVIKLMEALDTSADYLLRNELPAGKGYTYNEIGDELDTLNPEQCETAMEIINAYIDSLD